MRLDEPVQGVEEIAGAIGVAGAQVDAKGDGPYGRGAFHDGRQYKEGITTTNFALELDAGEREPSPMKREVVVRRDSFCGMPLLGSRRLPVFHMQGTYRPTKLLVKVDACC